MGLNPSSVTVLGFEVTGKDLFAMMLLFNQSSQHQLTISQIDVNYKLIFIPKNYMQARLV